MSNILKKMFYKNRWSIAYRINNLPDINPTKCKDSFKLISFPKDYCGADPFLYRFGDKIFVFCELINMKKSKAVIAFKELYPNEARKWITAYEFEGHTSYPCLFEFDGDLFMIPETTYSKNIVVLRYEKELKKWILHSVLRENINAPDTTFVIYKDSPCAFVYEVVSQNDRRLHFIKFDNKITRIISDAVVERYNCPNGRPGGQCICYGEQMYRIVQPGIKHYGEKIVFYSFEYKADNYNEKPEFELTPNEVKIETKQKIIGIHTYNRLENIEIIDVLFKGQFEIFRPLKIILKRLQLFGYGTLEARKKYLNKKEH